MRTCSLNNRNSLSEKSNWGLMSNKSYYTSSDLRAAFRVLWQSQFKGHEANQSGSVYSTTD